MAKIQDLSKLRRENEILRRELETLRSSSKNAPTMAIATTQKTANAKQPVNNSTLVLDFRFLKKDLTRTAFLTVACVGIIASLYVFKPQIPGLQRLISHINI